MLRTLAALRISRHAAATDAVVVEEVPGAGVIAVVPLELSCVRKTAPRAIQLGSALSGNQYNHGPRPNGCTGPQDQFSASRDASLLLTRQCRRRLTVTHRSGSP